MIETKNLPNAYVEVLEVLKYIPNEDYKKIPEYIINGLNDNKNENYNYSIENYNKNIMLYETNVILAILFRDYWATEEQKKKIKAKEEYDLNKLEIEKSKKYNTDDIFKNNESKDSLNDISINNEKEEEEENVLIVQYNEPLLKRILNKIKLIFTKR